jgi:hypothetical protein
MSAVTTAQARTAPRWNLRQREAALFYLCISPWIIGFLLFYLGPILASFYFSLTEWDLLTPPKFIGLANYVRVFTRDPLAIQSFKVTLVYTLAYVPTDLAFGLLLALLLNRKLRGIGVFRTIYYLPSVLSGVAYVVMWMWMFNPQHGRSTPILRRHSRSAWLLDPNECAFVMSLWGGRSTVIFLAGLGIPNELYVIGGYRRRNSGTSLNITPPADASFVQPDLHHLDRNPSPTPLLPQRRSPIDLFFVLSVPQGLRAPANGHAPRPWPALFWSLVCLIIFDLSKWVFRSVGGNVASTSAEAPEPIPFDTTRPQAEHLDLIYLMLVFGSMMFILPSFGRCPLRSSQTGGMSTPAVDASPSAGRITLRR